MSTELTLLTNIQRIFEEIETFGSLEESFAEEYLPDDERKLEKLFKGKKFILLILNGDKPVSDSYVATLGGLIEKTNFPALVLACRKNIRKYMQRLPFTVDFMVKPVSRYEFNLRVNRLIEIYKIMKELDLLRNLEREIDIRGNIMELSRQELVDASETIRALDSALELSRQELMGHKEEIMAREQVLELSRQDEMDLLEQIRAFEEALRYADDERKFYEKEIDALENLLVYILRERKNRKERKAKKR